MADDIGDEPGFSQAQIRTIAQIVAAALAQDRAQNQTTPPSSSQPVVEERQIPEPVSDNQTSVGNTTPTENDVVTPAGLEDVRKVHQKYANMVLGTSRKLRGSQNWSRNILWRYGKYAQESMPSMAAAAALQPWFSL
ncbi:hypothetical protein JCGZ_00075 [Jatropha curcas]|uniref:Uncharacterized protein n=1 Tax=Jatropha curcas TaxID=180498 RepID=A0A067JUG4_JATCU|nr:hypothetical protein JCGZ_00075 [Jatropha curcas]